MFRYAFDFIAFPLLALLLIGLDCRSMGWVALAVAGVILFTLSEYFVHRWALHGMFFHSQHERHHTHPADYVTFPLWFTPALFLGFWLIMPTAVFAGFVVGYCWFLVWHHTLHHVDLTNWPAFVRRYAAWHLAHHIDDTVNFGISVPLWDRVFGSYRK